MRSTPLQLTDPGRAACEGVELARDLTERGDNVGRDDLQTMPAGLRLLDVETSGCEAVRTLALLLTTLGQALPEPGTHGGVSTHPDVVSVRNRRTEILARRPRLPLADDLRETFLE